MHFNQSVGCSNAVVNMERKILQICSWKMVETEIESENLTHSRKTKMLPIERAMIKPMDRQ